jgi:hypothetical protein
MNDQTSKPCASLMIDADIEPDTIVSPAMALHQAIHLRKPVLPRPPDDTTLIGIFGPTRTCNFGVRVKAAIYQSAALQDLARRLMGPIVVRVEDSVGVAPDVVYVRTETGWLTVPRVREIGADGDPDGA